MPRKDRTFSDKDILRLTFHYLDRKEKIRVLADLCGIGPEAPIPDTPPLPKAKTKAIKIQIEISRKTLATIKKGLDLLELIPGPQRGILTTINKSLDIIGKVLDTIDGLLE